MVGRADRGAGLLGGQPPAFPPGADPRVLRPAQYSGGCPVPAVGAAGSRQPGYLQVWRTIVVALTGPPRRDGLRFASR
ncbi:MAG: hypothetical protein ACRDPY_45375 [Streptosporangiaceae bacterium]